MLSSVGWVWILEDKCEMHKIYFHPCNLVYFYYSCHSAFPIYSLLADLPALLLKMIENPAASDHSTTPTLVPASVFSNRGGLPQHSTEAGKPCFWSHAGYDTNSWPGPLNLAGLGLCPPHRPQTLPLYALLLCSGHSGLARPQICQIPAPGPLRRLFFCIWNALCSGGFLAHSSIIFRSQRLSQLSKIKPRPFILHFLMLLQCSKEHFTPPCYKWQYYLQIFVSMLFAPPARI